MNFRQWGILASRCMAVLALCFAVGQLGTLTRMVLQTHNIHAFEHIDAWTVPGILMIAQTALLVVISIFLWARPAGFVQALEAANTTKAPATVWGIQKLAFKIIGVFLILWGLGEMMDNLGPQIFFYHDTWVPYTVGPISIATIGLLTLVIASVVPGPSISSQGIIQSEASSSDVEEEIKV